MPVLKFNLFFQVKFELNICFFNNCYIFIKMLLKGTFTEILLFINYSTYKHIHSNQFQLFFCTKYKKCNEYLWQLKGSPNYKMNTY